jgi:hypothetical protein
MPGSFGWRRGGRIGERRECIFGIEGEFYFVDESAVIVSAGEKRVESGFQL